MSSEFMVSKLWPVTETGTLQFVSISILILQYSNMQLFLHTLGENVLLFQGMTKDIESHLNSYKTCVINRQENKNNYHINEHIF